MKVLTGVLLLGYVLSAGAQHVPGYNYDEAKIPPYTMLDPLVMLDGTPVKTAAQWGVRRREIVGLFEENVFGKTPKSAKVPLRAKVIEMDAHALGGLAVRKQVDLYFSEQGDAGPKMRLLVYLPSHAKGPVPVVLGLNFGGNQTVIDDAGIQPTMVWVKAKPALKLEHVVPEEKTRGSQMKEWQVRMILERGYGLATAYYGDLEPDFKDADAYSVRRLFQTEFAADDWGALGAWAWGLSRAVDYLISDKAVDAKRIAVTGHSRLGKAADWAAAQDMRIAVLLSTESGKGGQSLERRGIGESVEHLQHSFPYWFCANYAQWVGKDQEIPADGNLMLALMAPRPVYVASAAGDEWSDPKGEFLSAVSASRVYALLGHQGLAVTEMPAVDVAVHAWGSDVGYHVRSGVHDVTAFDWEQYLSFLDEHDGRGAR
ncbi:hypothetical protein SAMN05421771_2197 [Granulicella pectinivorans]|uniref:4-O-methyl-glucuronoyl methylesterase-like domain-containing protein n=1 Tax=Granulicella pectinivorans TaxID=474950 RepID=A0A1I6MBA0_9BACT|nr:hypothetical protein [Granulicella pectinivorans]SFS12868.1 hypothetical protein SAMN05421771_2197 [Granulicella pectinivorans]